MPTKIKMAVPSDEVIRQDISDILRDADLTSLSSKKVRLQLAEKYNCDLTERKDTIDRIVMEVISEGLHNEDKKPASKTTTSKPPTTKPPAATSSSKASAAKAVNGKKRAKESDDESDGDEEMKSDEVKCKSDSELDDEDLARKLQEEEEQRGGRRTRKCVAQAAGRSKKKSKTKDAITDKPKRITKYNEACKLSPQLAAIVGEERLPRCEVVKKMWVIIKERNLYDPKNKQYMLCDDQLLTVFGRKKVRTFGMMKYLKDHISSPGTELD